MAPLVALRADDVAIPARGTEIRADGVWACLTCEEPLVHWSVGLESFAVAYDDPLEGWRSERGDVVPFGFDLEWTASAPAVHTPPGDGYGQWCDVEGEVLIGDQRLEVAASGFRAHAWGAEQVPPWRVAVPPVWAEAGWPGAAAQIEWDGDLPLAIGLGDERLVVDRSRVSPVAASDRPVHCVCRSADGAWGWASLRR